MEIRVLEYFLAIAREESISKAAEVLHITQPTLSRQMKELEDEFQKQLFIFHEFFIYYHAYSAILSNK